MLSKCANPECPATLHYLRSGKVFKIELEGPVLVTGKKAVRRVEHFWLCGPCSETKTLTYEPVLGVQISKKKDLVRRAVAS